MLPLPLRRRLFATRLSSCFFFFSSRRRHTRLVSDWSSDVCSSDLPENFGKGEHALRCRNWTNRSATPPSSVDMHNEVKSRSRRGIPAVNKVLDALGRCDLPRPITVDLIRRELSKIRAKGEIPEFQSIVDFVRRALEGLRASRLQPVINGTGIVIHTNLGRAPLAPEAVGALNKIGSGYSSLEYDVANGERGRRGAYIEN